MVKYRDQLQLKHENDQRNPNAPHGCWLKTISTTQNCSDNLWVLSFLFQEIHFFLIAALFRYHDLIFCKNKQLQKKNNKSDSG